MTWNGCGESKKQEVIPDGQNYVVSLPHSATLTINTGYKVLIVNYYEIIRYNRAMVITISDIFFFMQVDTQDFWSIKKHFL